MSMSEPTTRLQLCFCQYHTTWTVKFVSNLVLSKFFLSKKWLTTSWNSYPVSIPLFGQEFQVTTGYIKFNTNLTIQGVHQCFSASRLAVEQLKTEVARFQGSNCDNTQGIHQKASKVGTDRTFSSAKLFGQTLGSDSSIKLPQELKTCRKFQKGSKPA